ncbi:MAG: DUF2252 family protein, partial [Candidatus Sulfotelmatobacter sp.]
MGPRFFFLAARSDRSDVHVAEIRSTAVSHADWDPKHRRISILELLRASERGRLANLLPIKAARMAASPFGFYRGAVPIMASDLSMLPSSGIYAQLCGDAHV